MAFGRFDKMLDIMGVSLQGEREAVREREDALRCLPLQLLLVVVTTT